MIIDCYDIETEQIISLRDFYGEQKHIVDRCLIIFSKELHTHMLENFNCEEIGVITACNGNTSVYKTNYKGTDVAFYLTAVGSAAAASQCYEVSWVTGASKFIMFGSCGSLDKEKTNGKFIVPTESYRGDGCSYYFAPPSDYVTVKNSQKLSNLLNNLGVPHVRGKVWTTDSMIRETRGLVAKRKEEGCIAVEMELAGVQATCDFYDLELYNFLEAGDVLEAGGYQVNGLAAANHNLGKLYIALEIARQI